MSKAYFQIERRDARRNLKRATIAKAKIRRTSRRPGNGRGRE